MLRAVPRAWSWWRKLESGQASTNLDLAGNGDVSDRCIGRMTARKRTLQSSEKSGM